MKMKTLTRVISIFTILFSCFGYARVTLADAPYVGEIRWVAFTFAPQGWAKCDGQLMPISQNQALYSLLGTQFGGDGRTTFALPDLRGRAMMHSGNGPGLGARSVGQEAGRESEQLSAAQLPAHKHLLGATDTRATSNLPHDRVVAQTGRLAVYADVANTAMSPNALGASGGNQSHNNMPPFVTLQCIISLAGIFPSRN